MSSHGFFHGWVSRPNKDPKAFITPKSSGLRATAMGYKKWRHKKH